VNSLNERQSAGNMDFDLLENRNLNPPARFGVDYCGFRQPFANNESAAACTAVPLARREQEGLDESYTPAKQCLVPSGPVHLFVLPAPAPFCWVSGSSGELGSREGCG